MGLENGRIGAGAVDVTAVTLDEAIPAHIDEIDVLLTDTEGSDFDVLEGAMQRWVKPGRVGLYLFELMNGTNRRPLQSIVADFYDAGFTCYYILRPPAKAQLLRVSGDCWRPEYNERLRGWKNMVCANQRRFPELNQVLQWMESVPAVKSGCPPKQRRRKRG